MVRFYFIFDGYGFPLCDKHASGLSFSIETELPCDKCEKENSVNLVSGSVSG